MRIQAMTNKAKQHYPTRYPLTAGTKLRLYKDRWIIVSNNDDTVCAQAADPHWQPISEPACTWDRRTSNAIRFTANEIIPPPADGDKPLRVNMRFKFNGIYVRVVSLSEDVNGKTMATMHPAGASRSTVVHMVTLPVLQDIVNRAESVHY
jgi:hypothetical protein